MDTIFYYLTYLVSFIFGNLFLILLGVVAFYFLFDKFYLGFLPDPRIYFRRREKIRRLSKLVTINPHDGKSLKELGLILIEKKKYKQALEAFSKAESKMSQDAEFNFYYAIAIFRMGDKEKAMQVFENAVKISPSIRYGEPYLLLGEAAIDIGDFSAAQELLEKFRSIHTSSSRGLYRLGVTNLALGNKVLAKENFKQAIEAFKTDPFFKRKTDRKWAWKSRWKLISTWR